MPSARPPSPLLLPQLLVMVMLNGTCLKVKDLSTVLGYGIIMVSSSSMLPSFVYLARFLEGFPDVQHMVGSLGRTWVA